MIALISELPSLPCTLRFKMKTTILVSLVVLVSFVSAQGPPLPPDGPPEINWGKCEALKPTETEKEEKKKVIDECLKETPPPNEESINEEEINRHREKITVCALKKEKWLKDDGPYDFERAFKELEPKVPKEIKEVIAKEHDGCKQEATEKIPEDYAGQAQLYQACMDFHVSEQCGIQVVPPPHP